MATEQHANGTPTEVEIGSILRRYFLDAFESTYRDATGDIQHLLAKRPASYTPEQIETAVRYANKQHRTRPQWGDDDVVNCVLTTLQPAPKTAEERVKDVLIKHVYISGSKLQPSDELVSELLLAARKETHNG